MGIDSNAVLTEEMREKLLSAIRTVDPDFPEQDLKPDLILEHIPDWDSLTQVNFAVSLEQSFGLEPEQINFSGTETIQEVIQALHQVIG